LPFIESPFARFGPLDSHTTWIRFAGALQSVDAKAALVVADLTKRYCKTPTNPQFNWCSDIFTRWHREALYFVAMMRTPHGRPPTFETHAAHMEHVGDGKFNLAVPMRRGWNTVKRSASPEECLKEVSDLIYL
jgi:hypothetical protein